MLNTYLKRAGIVSGPLFSNTSHSALDVIKKHLCGLAQFKGGEVYLHFGNALHEKWLKGITTTYKKLDTNERAKLDAMVKKLNTNPVVKKLFKDSVREDKFYTTVHGVLMAMILDIKQPKLKIGSDLKTTFCTSFIAFLSHAIKSSLFRQAHTYIVGDKLEQFYFIAISKSPPHEIFILDVFRYKNEMAYAEQELKFLTYFFKHYGKIIDKSEHTNSTIVNKEKSSADTKEAGTGARNKKLRAVRQRGKTNEVIKRTSKGK